MYNEENIEIMELDKKRKALPVISVVFVTISTIIFFIGLIFFIYFMILEPSILLVIALFFTLFACVICIFISGFSIPISLIVKRRHNRKLGILMLIISIAYIVISIAMIVLIFVI